METTTDTVIGCDLGDKYSHVCVLVARGVQLRTRIRTSVKAMQEWFSQYRGATVVIEAGTHSRWVQRELAAIGCEVLVANPRQLRLIYAGRRKNDRLDAEKLARLARADRTLLAPIQHRSDHAHGQLEMLRARDQLVKARTELINHVRGVSKSFGVRLPKCTSDYFARKCQSLLPPAGCGVLKPMLQSIQHLTERIKCYEKQIANRAASDPGAQAIMTIKGVGPLTAMAFILTLDEPERFGRSRDVGAFLGLVPKQRQSSDDDPELRIDRAGDEFVRKLLVNCAQHILGPHGIDSDLRRHGTKLHERGGKHAKKKAVVAVARKLAVLMHRLWITGEVYEPLRAQSSALAV